MGWEPDNPTVMAYANLAKACQDFVIKHGQLEKQSRKSTEDVKWDHAVARATLSLHALNEALQLTPGDFDEDYGEIEACQAVLAGKTTFKKIMENTRKREMAEKALETAVFHDENGDVFEFEPGNHAFTVTDAWREGEQLHVKIRRSSITPATEEDDE